MSGRGRRRSGNHGGGGNCRGYNGGSTTGRSNKSKSDNGSNGSSSKQKLFQPHQVSNQHVDAFDSVLETHLTTVQKALVDGEWIVKAMRDGDWKGAELVKPTITKIDFRKQDDDRNLILTSDGEEQCETEAHKLE